MTLTPADLDKLRDPTTNPPEGAEPPWANLAAGTGARLPAGVSYQKCHIHDVTWRGSEPCWCCRPDMPSEGQNGALERRTGRGGTGESPGTREAPRTEQERGK